MRRFFLAIAILIAGLVLGAPSLFAAPITIKLASIAPERSPWGEALERLALEWRRISNGQVELKVYHNGVAGNEVDMLSKLRLGQLQAGVVTSAGLATLSPEVLSLSIPFLIRTDVELDRALADTRELMEERISKKGFTVLTWNKIGWLNFFTKKQIRTPDELRALKLAGGVESETLTNAFKQLGFQIIPVPTNELVTALNSGMVEAFYASPLGAAGMQWFAGAPNLLELPISPFVGVIVITNTAWRRIPERLRAPLMAAAAQAGKSLDGAIASLDRDALNVMKKNGLSITRLSEAEVSLWKEDFDKSTLKTVGTVFPQEMYDLIKKSVQSGDAQ